jgi:hypothetical protein
MPLDSLKERQSGKTRTESSSAAGKVTNKGLKIKQATKKPALTICECSGFFVH